MHRVAKVWRSPWKTIDGIPSRLRIRLKVSRYVRGSLALVPSPTTYFSILCCFFTTFSALKRSGEIGISRFEFRVLGVETYCSVVFKSQLYIRPVVPAIVIIRRTISTSFHCRAHTSPMRKPQHRAIIIPIFCGVGSDAIVFSSFLWSGNDSTGKMRAAVFEGILNVPWRHLKHTPLCPETSDGFKHGDNVMDRFLAQSCFQPAECKLLYFFLWYWYRICENGHEVSL